jgi:hypothetical protein
MSDSTLARTLPLAGSLRTPLIWLIILMSTPLVIGAVVVGLALPTQGLNATAVHLPMAMLLAPLLIVLVFAFLIFNMTRAGVRVEKGYLEVNSGFGSKRIALTALRNAELRIVDLHEHTQLKPSRKLGGAGLPRFTGGWFLLRNGERALCLLLARDRVCYLHSDDGTALLLSLQHPETLRALLAAH